MKGKKYLGGVVYTFDLRTQEEETGRHLELEVHLVYRVNYKTARATQKNPVSKKVRKHFVFLS